MAKRTLTLYDVLPEYIRQQDSNLHTLKLLRSADDLLDQVHETLQQYYADNFVDQPDHSEPAPAFDKVSQDWLLPYFADLLDVRQVSPLIEGRRDEITHAISWRQRKGTLSVVDAVVEAVGQWEAVVQEGWQRVAMTPRFEQPLLPESYFGAAPALNRDIPQEMARHPGLASVTPDFRRGSRAVVDENNIPSSQVSNVYGESMRWRQYYPHGVPCHHQRVDLNGNYNTAAFDDVSKRTPDIRDSNWQVGHFHPRKVLIHVVQPQGFFQAQRVRITWKQQWLTEPTLPSNKFLEHICLYSKLSATDKPINWGGPFDPALVFENRNIHVSPFMAVELIGRMTKGAPGEDDPEYVDDAIVEADPYSVWQFAGIILKSHLTLHSGRAQFDKCAVNKAEVHDSNDDTPVINATNTLFKEVHAATGLVRLEYCTVLQRCLADSLQASDCIFNGYVHKDVPNDKAPSPMCIRYSLIREDQMAARRQ
ncbi:phage tail protein [Pseudoalteromonas sp. GB56]